MNILKCVKNHSRGAKPLTPRQTKVYIQANWPLLKQLKSRKAFSLWTNCFFTSECLWYYIWYLTCNHNGCLSVSFSKFNNSIIIKEEFAIFEIIMTIMVCCIVNVYAVLLFSLLCVMLFWLTSNLTKRLKYYQLLLITRIYHECK